MSVVTRVGLVVTVPIVLLCGTVGPRIRLAAARPPLAAAALVPTVSDDHWLSIESTSAVQDDDVSGTVDLYGNQVTDAVAKYQLDAAGSLYETHSPQTELPRLKSPQG